jgi:enoyl-[acyl-carrier protein] reductase II
VRRPVFDNRITRLLGIDIPITNAPMGGVVTPTLVSAVLEAGAMGLVPGSMGPAYARNFIQGLADKTNRPFGVNIPVSHVGPEPKIVDMILELGIKFVTTSTGRVPPYAARLKDAGVTVFHVVTSLETAREAADAGVDGLIVEGAEGGGQCGTGEVSMMVLLPMITSQIHLPVIAAGGIADGASMAAAFALGAEGVQMGTRMLASAESSVHDNFKQAVVLAAETDTMLLDRHNARPMRVLRTKATEPYEFATEGDAFKDLVSGVRRLYEHGEMEAGFAPVGQTIGRVEEILPVAEIIRRTIEEFGTVLSRLQGGYLAN